MTDYDQAQKTTLLDDTAPGAGRRSRRDQKRIAMLVLKDKLKVALGNFQWLPVARNILFALCFMTLLYTGHLIMQRVSERFRTPPTVVGSGPDQPASQFVPLRIETSGGATCIEVQLQSGVKVPVHLYGQGYLSIQEGGQTIIISSDGCDAHDDVADRLMSEPWAEVRCRFNGQLYVTDGNATSLRVVGGGSVCIAADRRTFEVFPSDSQRLQLVACKGWAWVDAGECDLVYATDNCHLDASYCNVVMLSGHAEAAVFDCRLVAAERNSSVTTQDCCWVGLLDHAQGKILGSRVLVSYDRSNFQAESCRQVLAMDNATGSAENCGRVDAQDMSEVKCMSVKRGQDHQQCGNSAAQPDFNSSFVPPVVSPGAVSDVPASYNGLPPVGGADHCMQFEDYNY